MVALFAPHCITYLLPAYFGNIFKERIGNILMIVVGLLALFNIKLPMPKLKNQTQAIDIPSTFILGIISGITSSCCAPVLIGVLTLSAFSSSLIMALGIGIAYVFGMVAPLYLASAFIHRRNLLEKPLFRRQLTTYLLG